MINYLIFDDLTPHDGRDNIYFDHHCISVPNRWHLKTCKYVLNKELTLPKPFSGLHK